LGATGSAGRGMSVGALELRVFGMLIVASGSRTTDDVEGLGIVTNVLRVLGAGMFGKAKPLDGGDVPGFGLEATVTVGRARVEDDLGEDACAGLRVGAAGRGRDGATLEITVVSLGRGLGPWYFDSRNGTGPHVSTFGRLLDQGDVLLPNTSSTRM
jgi:hypothetical protein